MGLAVVVAAWELYRKLRREKVRVDDSTRFRRNYRVRNIHAQAGNRWYPHAMANGMVRWYPVDHGYPVEL